MKRQSRKKTVQQIAVLLVLGLIYLFLYRTLGFGIPCIFRTLTGLKCPGCGMTHAIAEISKGNLKGAMEYNALSLTVLPVLVIYLIYRSLREDPDGEKEFYLWEYVLLIAALVVAIGYACLRN